MATGGGIVTAHAQATLAGECSRCGSPLVWSSGRLLCANANCPTGHRPPEREAAEIASVVTIGTDLCDRRAMDPGDGSARLLRALVRRGLRREALPVAAGLVLALEATAQAEAAT